MVTIGCGRTIKPVTFSVLGKDGKDKAVRGTVSYIHPARRYCILEFAVRGGILRESFQLIDGEIAEKRKAGAYMERRPMKLYLVRHAEYGETTANGRCKYDAIIAAARQWRARWTQIARECEFIVLAEEEPASTEQ